MKFKQILPIFHQKLPSRAIVSFPKSGRSWYRVLLDELNLKVKFDHAGSDLLQAKNWRELDTSVTKRYSKIVLLTRDPRDAVVSAYYHLRDREDQPYKGQISEFIRDPNFGIEKAARFNLMWSEVLTNNGGLCISYESTHADAFNTLAKVIRYFEHSCTMEQIYTVAMRNTFSEMRAREARGEYDDRFRNALGATRPGDLRSLKLRKGQVGSHRDELSEDDLVYCDSLFRKLNYFSHLESAADIVRPWISASMRD